MVLLPSGRIAAARTRDEIAQPANRVVVRLSSGEHQPQRDQRKIRRPRAEAFHPLVKRRRSLGKWPFCEQTLHDLASGRHAIEKIAVERLETHP